MSRTSCYSGAPRLIRETAVATKIPTGWGEFTALLGGGGVRRLLFPGQPFAPNPAVGDRIAAAAVPAFSRRSDPENPPASAQTIPEMTALLTQELNEYLAGRREQFTVPLDLPATPPFTVRIWRELAQIPYGQTATYGEIAQRVGNPRASRAVGNACGANPVPLLIPCHRVLAANGHGGFSAGLEWKFRLLQLEAR